MRRMKQRFLKLAAIAVVATVRAIAQEGHASTRRIVVSIPDRKLAWIENGRVVKIYETAVGAPSTPSPAGTFTIVNRTELPAVTSSASG